MNNKTLQTKKTKGKEPDYYYTPEGLLVFTASYHLKRGYCCQSGCRHCPYNFKKLNSQSLT